MLVKLPWGEYVSSQDVLTVCLEPQPKDERRFRVRVTMKGMPYSHSPWLEATEARAMSSAVARIIGLDDIEGDQEEGAEEANGLIQLPWQDFVNAKEVLTVCLEPKPGTKVFRVRVTMKGNGNPYTHCSWEDRATAEKIANEVAETIGIEEIIEQKL